MTQEVLLGDEAVALGAIHAGMSAGYSYPGTPASEIMEFLVKKSRTDGGFIASWCVNEKVAYEEALGVSFAGKRAMVSMKHVGLNVAADPFMNSALIPIGGGLVVVVADDPGMHSSQNEQDSRYYAQFAKIFCFEPSNHQEAYDMTRAAFDLSEANSIPVLIRLVTRLSHNRSRIIVKPPCKQKKISAGGGPDWTLLPLNARRRFQKLIERQGDLVRISERSEFNQIELKKKSTKIGIIASGIAHRYVKENIHAFPQEYSLLKISTYPLPETIIKKLVGHVDTVLVVEEGYPFIESQIKGIFGVPDKDIRGKLSGHLSATGELTPDNVRQALGLESRPRQTSKDFPLASRPPQLCQGCSHSDTFRALNKALESYPQPAVFSDIGCYTLGALPPYNAIDTCVCMGASVSMAKGGAEAGLSPSLAVIGDSTFGHSGLTPLLDAAVAGTNMTVIIADNATVAMTGGQPSFASGDRLIRIIEGLGISKEHIKVIVPLPKNLTENVKIIKEEIDHNGLSVIVSFRECVQETRKRARRRSTK